MRHSLRQRERDSETWRSKSWRKRDRGNSQKREQDSRLRSSLISKLSKSWRENLKRNRQRETLRKLEFSKRLNFKLKD